MAAEVAGESLDLRRDALVRDQALGPGGGRASQPTRRKSKMASDVTNLQAALVAEIARVRDQVVPQYQSLPYSGGAAALAVVLWPCIRGGEAALASGDPHTMIKALAGLRGCR